MSRQLAATTAQLLKKAAVDDGCIEKLREILDSVKLENENLRVGAALVTALGGTKLNTSEIKIFLPIGQLDEDWFNFVDALCTEIYVLREASKRKKADLQLGKRMMKSLV